MAHAHAHHAHSHADAGRNISLALILNAAFVVIEVVAGFLTNSIAILTDALHDLGDCLSLGTALYLQRKSERGRDQKYSYGYKRFSLLGSIFLSGVLTVSSIVVVIEAVKRIITPEEVQAEGMFWVAVFGVIVNGAAAFRVKQGHSINERSVYLHIMEDVLGWVGVLVVSVVMLFIDIPWLDPLLSIGISGWVLLNVYHNLRHAFTILLQAVPDDLTLAQLQSQLEGLEGVESIHSLHLWSLDGETHVMTLHVVTSVVDTAAVKARIVAIAEANHVGHTTIEFERPGVVCTTRCD